MGEINIINILFQSEFYSVTNVSKMKIKINKFLTSVSARSETVFDRAIFTSGTAVNSTFFQ